MLHVIGCSISAAVPLECLCLSLDWVVLVYDLPDELLMFVAELANYQPQAKSYELNELPSANSLQMCSWGPDSIACPVAQQGSGRRRCMHLANLYPSKISA